MNIITDSINLSVADGTTMQAYTASPSDGKFPGIIVFQEAFGVNGHIKKIAERFANEGFVAIAPEMFHRTAPVGFTSSYTDFEAVRPHTTALKPEEMAADATSAFEWLQNNPLVQKDNIVCIGFCMGGRVSFIANTQLPLKAAVSYYGGGLVPDLIKLAPSLHAPMLFYWGGLDKHIKTEHVNLINEELAKSGNPYINTVISYADHGFNCDERPAYNEQASKEAWAMTMAFLRNNLEK